MSTPKAHDRQIPFLLPAQFVDYIKNNFYFYSKVLHSFFNVAFMLLSWDSMHFSFTHERFQNYLLQGPDHSRTNWFTRASADNWKVVHLSEMFCILKDKNDAGMAQWWEHSPTTNVKTKIWFYQTSWLPPWKIWKADVSSVSPSSERMTQHHSFLEIHLPPMWPDSIPISGVICGLSLLVLYSARRGFLRLLRFPLPSKTSIWLDLC